MRSYLVYIAGSILLLAVTGAIWYRHAHREAPLDLVDPAIRQAEAKAKAERFAQDSVFAAHEIVLRPDWASLDREIADEKAILKEMEGAQLPDPKAAEALASVRKTYEEALVQLQKRKEEDLHSIVLLLQARLAKAKIEKVSLREVDGNIAVTTPALNGPSYRALMSLLTQPGRLRMYLLAGGLGDKEEVRAQNKGIGDGAFAAHLLTVLPAADRGPCSAQLVLSEEYVVVRVPFLDSPQVFEAEARKNRQGQHAVLVSLSPVSGGLLRGATKRIVGNPIAIALDDRVYMTPVITQPVGPDFQIAHASFTEEDMSFFVATLTNRPLPVPMLVASDTPKQP